MNRRWPGRLRVAVPRQIEWWSPRTGHGRVWHAVLPLLARRVRLHQIGDGGGRRPLRPPDVWLADGHEAPDGLGRPLVIEIHEASWLDPELRAHVPGELVDELVRGTEAAVRAADQVITLSEWSRRTIVDGGLAPAERVHAVWLGADPGTFSPAAQRPERVAELLPGLARRPYVLFVGHAGPRKNIPALREAMAALGGDGFPHALVLVVSEPPGHPDAAELCRAATAELPGAPGRVLTAEAGSDDDLAVLMAGASALCLPSFAEGFGLPAAEAMACGTPVVVSDRGALPEVVGDAGVVVEPTAAAIRDGLANVLGDPATTQRLSHAGRERAASLTWDRTADGWLAVLKAAAGA
jgi:glycosyltransferase involved in cell wall biosynthesis